MTQVEQTIDFLIKTGCPVFIEETAPEGCFRPGLWLLPDGIHVIPGQTSPGRLAHEAGHYLFLDECDRALLRPGSLSHLGLRAYDDAVEAVLQDSVVDAWAGAVVAAAGLRLRDAYTDIEDYSGTICEVPSKLIPDLIALNLQAYELPGSILLRRMGMCQDYPHLHRWRPNRRAIDIFKAFVAENKTANDPQACSL